MNVPEKVAENVREKLLQHLKELCLPSMRKRFAEEARRAERETLSYEHYLLELVRTECEVRRSNRIERVPFSKWESIFKDAMTTAAAIDRLVHHSVILELNLPSYRLEQAKKAKEKETKDREGSPAAEAAEKGTGSA
jgi:DNA replication protein DnaC